MSDVAELYERYLVKVDDADDEDDPRSPVAKDRDRIVHSSAFRRLQGKSQIVGVDAGDFYRTRLTHTIECAQIGRGIAAAVADGEDLTDVVDEPAHLPEVVEAACLAHDLGHPPYGHNGERALDAKMRERDGSLFEGNAQSFRVVTYQEPKLHGYTKTGGGDTRSVGLDLTRATLRALMKYPWAEGTEKAREKHKFGVYKDPTDLAYHAWVWDGPTPDDAILSGRIMDRADDIAYAVHDFEDGVWGGMVPLYEFLTPSLRVVGRLEEHYRETPTSLFPDGETIVATVRGLFASERLDYLRDGPFDRTRYHRAALKNFTAELIGGFIKKSSAGGQFRNLPVPDARRLKLLKDIAWIWMINRSDIATVRFGQRKLIEQIYDGYWEMPAMLPHRQEWNLIAQTEPKDALGRKKKRWPEKARLIRDHIAGMTDGYAREVYEQMYGARQHRDLRLAY
jgi:dGTPase